MKLSSLVKIFQICWVLHLIGIEFYLYLNVVKDFLDIFPVDDIALILVSV